MSPEMDLSPRAIAQLVETLARFSAPGPGVTRLVYDDTWIEAQAWMSAQARARGLAATPDAAGNLMLHAPALDHGSRGFFTGSHLDTVAQGGKLDGAYGALAGLLLAASLQGETALPVVGLVTCEEEGSRFPNAFLGARAMLGRVAVGELDAQRDAAGTTWRAALEAAAAHGAAARGGIEGPTATFAPAGFLELHIEQGPVLEAEGAVVGIVDRIAGFRRMHARITGEARHAGTTPMRLRRDALAAAAEIVLAAESMALELGHPAVATAGAAHAAPGLYNVVPGTCELKLECRHVEREALAQMAIEIERACRGIAARRGVTLAFETVSAQDPIAMDEGFVAEAESLARERGVRAHRMASGAGHDAMIFAAAGVPSLMLFVPSFGGISHSPEEFTTPEALAAGVAFARELLPRLAAKAGA